jgi:hypothetical protein
MTNRTGTNSPLQGYTELLVIIAFEAESLVKSTICRAIPAMSPANDSWFDITFEEAILVNSEYRYSNIDINITINL